MLSHIILFVTAALGFLCLAYILGKDKMQQNSLVNKYLVIIISITSIRFFVYWISQAYPEYDLLKFIILTDVSSAMLMPCFYLYFNNIVYEKKFEVGNLYHFLVPFILGAIYFPAYFFDSFNKNLLVNVSFIITILLYLIYAGLSFVLLYKSVWRRKSDIKAIQQQNDLIKSWSIFLYTAFIAMVLIRGVLRIISNSSGYSIDFHIWIPGLLWIGIFVKLILTPEILYGYNFLNKAITAATEKVILHSVWKLGGSVAPIISEKDNKLSEKIKPLLSEYLHQIEALSFHSYAFRNPDFSLDDIAVSLKIPISHINFIFKYHCNESFTDYKKIVRIHDATKLLEGGYLNKYKVETLSVEVGFSSYNTFNVAFKSITGVTAQEYTKRL